MGKRLNFSVGPVMMSDDILQIGKEQIPYFRTEAFSNIMKENEKIFIELVDSPSDSRLITLTASGTAAMEMAVINSFDSSDKVLVVNGGGFGQRFADICDIYNIPYDDIKLAPGERLTKETLREYDNKNFTGMLINMHETSTGTLYDMEIVSEFCKKNNVFLIVDAISSFLADKISMMEYSIDMLITSSQKALALPPGLSFIVLNKKSVDRINSKNPKTLYFDMKIYLKNGERGQTPFTPAVSVILQLNKRLQDIKKTGVKKEIESVSEMAQYFRNKIQDMPFEIFSQSPSNAVTALEPTCGISPQTFFEILDREYNIWICPNGGKLGERIFRVGHIGNVDKGDYDRLISALRKIVEEYK